MELDLIEGRQFAGFVSKPFDVFRQKVTDADMTDQAPVATLDERPPRFDVVAVRRTLSSIVVIASSYVLIGRFKGLFGKVIAELNAGRERSGRPENPRRTSFA
ncbi:MAG TPA: hypothetical protein VGE75_06360 [Acidimicrobiales bacterium]